MTRAAALADLPSLDDGGILTQDAINACAEFVRGASDRDLEAAMTAEGARVLELVLAGMRGSYVGAAEIQAEIVWRLSVGGQPWTRFITRLSQGKCTVLQELPASPRLSLAMEGVTFLRMVTGGASPLKLFATGQLKTHGDLTFAAGLTKLFLFPDSHVSRLARWRRRGAERTPRPMPGRDSQWGRSVGKVVEQEPDVMASKRVLLTGASGVLGRAVLARCDPEHTTCLLHHNTVSTRGEWLAGTIADTNFGLSRSEYDELARRVDVIVHCAAITDYSAPEREMNAVNVEGVKHVLEFASRAGAHLYHVSTAFVLRTFEEHETWRAPSSRWWDPAVYLESKRIGDQLVADSGLAAAIVRPSLTFGDSATGATVRFQGVHTVIRAFFSNNLPLVPAMPKARIDYLPTNVVAELVARLTDLRLIGDLWLTAGDEALTAREVLRIGTDYLAEKGIAVAPPRMVAPDMMERLIVPVFLPELPKRLRRRYEQLLVLAPLFFHDDPYPSDLRTLERTLETSFDLQLASSLINALEYWRATSRQTGVHA